MSNQHRKIAAALPAAGAEPSLELVECGNLIDLHYYAMTSVWAAKSVIEYALANDAAGTTAGEGDPAHLFVALAELLARAIESFTELEKELLRLRKEGK